MSQYKKFIAENVAIADARRIAVYDENGKRVGQIPLGNLALKNTGRKLYTFGAISDVHIGQDTADSDFRAALTYLSENADFICICGDLIHGASDVSASQISVYTSCINACAKIPVYAIAGNHDGAYVANVETAITSYTGHPLYYSFERGNDVFVMVGNRSTGAGALFTSAELTWLANTLEANKTKRVFLFQHVRPDDGCGNALGIYKTDNWGGAEQTTFENLLRAYPNVVFFHGHSHLKFDMQGYSDEANLDRIFGCWSVHIPSIAVPRGPLSNVDTTLTTYYAESEGYIVDVYENGIHLRGRNFITGEFIPLASYWLETSN